MPPSSLSRRHLLAALPAVGAAAFGSRAALGATDAPPAVPPPAPSVSTTPEAVARNADRTACLIFEMSITQETMNALQNAFIELHKQGFRNITLMINSFGGAVSPVLAAYHFINTLSLNLTTYNMADVSSAAIILYLAGRTRIANDQSRFKFHASRNEVQGSFGSDEFNAMMTDVDEINLRIKEIYQSKMRLSDEQYAKMLSANLRSVRAKEALDIGLVTRIDEPSTANSVIYSVAVPTAKNLF